MKRERNMGGIAAVTCIHLAALLLILNNSTVSILRMPPAVIELVPQLVEPPKLPPPVPMPSSAPVLPTIAVPPLPDFPLAPAATPLSTRVATDASPPAQAPGGQAAQGGAAPVPRTPVQVAAVVDAKACARPDYPKSALRNGDTGTVMLAFLIGTDGRVADSRIEKSSGFRDLDRAAQSALSLCRFQPGTVDGVPYQSWTRMQYVWTLDE